MPYKVKKAIQQYSLVDLMEIMLEESHPEYQVAKAEFESRTPTDKELEYANSGLEIRLKNRDKPLSTMDKLRCFVIPFTTSKSGNISKSEAIDDTFEQRLTMFQTYGKSKRVEELEKWQGYAKITHTVLVILVGFWVIYVKYFMN